MTVMNVDIYIGKKPMTYCANTFYYQQRLSAPLVILNREQELTHKKFMVVTKSQLLCVIN